MADPTQTSDPTGTDTSATTGTPEPQYSHPGMVDARTGKPTANPINLGSVVQPDGGELQSKPLAVDDPSYIAPSTPDGGRVMSAWGDNTAFVEAIEQYARTTHGLSGDKQMLFDIAATLREVLDVPLPEPAPEPAPASQPVGN